MATQPSRNTHTPRRQLLRMERFAKGISHWRRIEALALLRDTPALSLQEVAGALRVGLMTAHQHMTKMVAAGLVERRRHRHRTHHHLTPRGRRTLVFLRGVA